MSHDLFGPVPEVQKHLCHHPECKVPVPPRMLACGPHWFQLPKSLRDEVWSKYREGQEITKTPSGAYLRTVMKCLDFWETHGS